MSDKDRKISFSLKKLLGIEMAEADTRPLSSLVSVLKLDVKNKGEFKRRYTICEMTPRPDSIGKPKNETFSSNRRKALAILSRDKDVVSTCNETGDLNQRDLQQNRTFILIRNTDCAFVNEKVKRIQESIFDYVLLMTVDQDIFFEDEELKYVPVRLLLNSLLRDTSSPEGFLEEGSFVNLMSDFIIFNPSWTKIDKKTQLYKSLYGLKIKIGRKGEINAGVVTFSDRDKVLEKLKYDKKLRERAAKLSPYVLTQNPIGLTPVVNYENENDVLYIQRSLSSKKNCVPECMFGSLQTFWNSKQGIISQAIRLFNELYGDLMTIELEKVELKDCINAKKLNERKKEQLSYFSEQLKQFHDFCVINRLGEFEEDNEYVQYLTKSIEKALGIASNNICYSDTPLPGYLNIIIDHDKDYYNNIKDGSVADKYTLDIQKEDSPVIQHITVETLQNITKSQKADGEESFVPDFLVFVLYNECIVKNDILQRRLSIPWERDYGYNISFARKYTFLVPSDDENQYERKERVLFMDIKADGAFELRCQYKEELDISDAMSEALVQMKEDDLAVHYEDQVAIISKAYFKVFNDYEGIEKYSNDYGLKGVDSRNLFFAGTFELRSFFFKGESYLVSGLYQDQIGPSNTINKGIIPRKLSYLTGDALGLEKMLLSQMNNVYISKDRISSYPFPAKYLNEWAKMLAAKTKEIVIDEKSADDIAPESGTNELDGIIPGFESFAMNKKQDKKKPMIGFALEKKQAELLKELANRDKGGNLSELLREVCELGLKEYQRTN